MTRREFYIMVLLIIIIFLIDKNHSLAQEILGSVDIHGFISQGYLKSDNNNFLSETEDGSFQFNEMGINFNTSLTDDLRLGIQFFSRDLGKNGNDEVVVDWALADYHFRDWMGLRVGKMKIPINLYNESRDIDMLRTQVLLPQSVYAELYRDIYATQKGFCLYGDIMIGYMGRIAYTLFQGTVNASEDSGMAEAYEDQFSDLNLEVNQLSVGSGYNYGITWYTFIEGLRSKFFFYKIEKFRVSGIFDHPLTDMLGFSTVEAELKPYGYSFSAEYTRKNYGFVGELLYYRNRATRDLGLGYVKLPTIEGLGWYVNAFYRLEDMFEIGYTYSQFFPDINNRNGTDTYPSDVYYDRMGISGRKRILDRDFEAWLITQTLSIRFNLNRSWLVKFEISYNDGFGAYTSAENDSQDLSRYWFLYAAKVTFTF